MSQWQNFTLGEILPFKYGKGLPERKRSGTGEYGVVSSAGITGTHNTALTSEPCVVIGRKGSIGSLYYCPDPVWPIDTTFYVTGTEQIELRYAYYLLHTLPFASMNNDSAVPGLNRSQAESLKVRVPDIPEQRRIAGVLGALDDKIESNVTVAGKLSELADALALQLIADTQVTQAPLSDIADINVKSPLDFRFEEIEYLDIKSCSTGYFENTTRIKMADAPSRARRRARDGDLIYSTVRPNKKVFSPIFDPVENLVISTGFAVVTPKFPTGSSFLAFVFGQDRFAEYLGAAAGGSAYPAVNIKAMENFPVTIPRDSSKILAYEESTLDMRRFASWLRRQNRKLAELRDALLPELMSGRMRVDEAGRLVSEALSEEVC